MITKEIVERAYERAKAEPGLLIEGALARNDKGNICLPTDENATCFCTLGLVCNEAGLVTDQYDVIAKAFGDEGRDVRVDNVIEITDDDTLTDVKPKCNPKYTRAVGLRGFEYLLETFK